MTKPLAHYFESIKGATTALKAYSDLAAKRGWDIPDKLRLYRLAKSAFDPKAERREAQAAFKDIYESLRKYWQVFRGASTYWMPAQVWGTLMSKCGPCSMSAAVTLHSDLEKPSGALLLKQHLETMQNIKAGKYYPTMPVAKFSHFFNPTLFPIYDTALVYNTVLTGAFKNDWKSFTDDLWEARLPSLDLVGKSGIWWAFAWIIWGSDMIRRNHPDLMGRFAGWFVRESEGEDSLLKEISSYYATAFEFIAIGAASLEGNGR